MTPGGQASGRAVLSVLVDRALAHVEAERAGLQARVDALEPRVRARVVETYGAGEAWRWLATPDLLALHDALADLSAAPPLRASGRRT